MVNFVSVNRFCYLYCVIIYREMCGNKKNATCKIWIGFLNSAMLLLISMFTLFFFKALLLYPHCISVVQNKHFDYLNFHIPFELADSMPGILRVSDYDHGITSVNNYALS